MYQRNYFRGFAPKPFDIFINKNVEMPSTDFMNKIGATLPEQMSFRTPLDNALGSSGAVVNQGSKLAENLGKVGTALGGVTSGLSAANDIANGDYVNGGLNAAKTAATFIPGAQPVAAAIQGAQIAKDLFGGLFGGGNDGSESLNETMNIRRNALNQTKQFAQNAQNQDYSQPVITGGAAPAEPQLTPIQEYQNALREQGYSNDVINGISQGLNSGDKNIAQWIEQYNNGTGKDNPIRIPQTEEDIALAKAGNFNVPTQNGEASEHLKKGLLDKFINGMTDLSKGYQENRNNAFKPENLQRDDSKSKMNKVGEALGTLGRVAQNPAVQGLVAGGLSAALTGNPLYGLGKGYEFANNRAMSDARKEALKQYGINLPEIGSFGNYSDKDVNALTTPYYKEAMNNIALAKLQEAQNYHNQMIENQKQLNNIRQQTADIKQQNANTQEYKAKNGSKVTHISNNSKPQNKGTSGSEATVQMQAPNGKIYLVPESQISRYKKAGGKIVG